VGSKVLDQYSGYKSLKEAAERWRKQMEKAPAHLRSSHFLTDADFKQRFQHAISKIDGVTLDIQGDSYIIREE
jgi:hypothetical protein|tara:strand:- start:158 stop:376 length:219 start_codon:yes stop_codon:yes gene_type:complete